MKVKIEINFVEGSFFLLFHPINRRALHHCPIWFDMGPSGF